jgi:hypothetical protein
VNLRVLIILLAVIVVLFIVGIGVGAGRDDRSAGIDVPAQRDQILQSLAPHVRPQALLPVTSGCLKPEGMIVVTPGRPCIVEIRDARSPVRTLRVRLEEGLSARLLLEHLGDQERISPNPMLPDKEGKSEVALSVLRDGARLHVTCQGGPSAEACELAVGSGAE